MNNRFRHFFSALVTVGVAVFWALLAPHGLTAEPESDATWRSYQVTLSFIDPKARIIVVADREISVPLNTPIFNHSGQAIAMANLRRGDKLWLYLDSLDRRTPAQAMSIRLMQP